MKRTIAFITTIACTFSSFAWADDGAADEIIEEAAITPSQDATPDQTPKSVGKAAVDGSTAAQWNTAGKYVLAAGAIAIGIAALILVSRNSGHKSHSHSH